MAIAMKTAKKLPKFSKVKTLHRILKNKEFYLASVFLLGGLNTAIYALQPLYYSV